MKEKHRKLIIEALSDYMKQCKLHVKGGAMGMVEIEEVIAQLEDDEGFFNVTSIHRKDLKSVGIDASKVPNEDMTELADKMADDYCTQLFWSSLETIAGEIMDLPKLKQKGE